MNDTDDWGRDPQVRAMRRVFSGMETLQSRLLEKMGVSPLDERLGPWRRAALRVFEQKWTELSGKGRHLSEEEVARIYLDSLANVLTKDGLVVSNEVLSALNS